MTKVILTVIVCVLVGFGLGQLQASLAFSSFEERFLGSRTTLAEARGEATAADLLASSSARGKLEIDGGTTFEFGTMRHGETMSHDFVFRNVGQDPLNLEMGAPTCKCTVGELDKSILQPGEETLVSLTWTAQSISPEYAQTATIYTTDPTQTEVQLRISGRIARSFVVEPPSISLGSFSVNEPISKTFHIFTYLEACEDLGQFTWAAESTRDLVTVDVEKLPLDGERFPSHRNARHVHEVTLHIAPGMPLGNLSSRIQFETDQPKNTGQLEVPVTGSVVGDFTLFGGASYNADKNVVDLGNVQSEEGAKLTIWLAAQGEHRDDVKPEVQSIVPKDALEVTIGEPSQRGKRRVFPIEFNVPKGAPEAYYPGSSGDKFGKVVINTNLDVAKEVPIFVRLIVKQ